MTTAVLIVAAGRGTRLGGDIPKQYVSLNGPPALRRSMERFLSLAEITSLQTVIHPEDTALYMAATEGMDDPRLLPPFHGGRTRAESVRNGLEALVQIAPEKVLIHDAARPFVSADIIVSVIHALDNADGASAALPVVDALWQTHMDQATHAVPREGLWRAQTPQGFRFERILAAHRAHDGSASDDVAVACEAGLTVVMVEGAEANYKITTAADLARARRHVEGDTT